MQYVRAIKLARDNNDVEAAAELRKRMIAEQSASDRKEYNPTAGNSFGQNFVEGFGSTLPTLGRGIKQLGVNTGNAVGIVSDQTNDRVNQEVTDAAKLDAPLRRTWGGAMGNIAGTVGVTAPLLFVPGANSVAGSAALGGGLGLIQPVAEGESRTKNVALGGVLGAGAAALPRLAVGGYQTIKGALSQFTKGGQREIAANALARAAGNSAEVAPIGNALAGTRQTVAQLADNAGLAQLERQVRNHRPEMFARVDAQNADAMLGAVGKIAGTDADRAAAVAARDAAASPFYQQAENSGATVNFSAVESRPAVAAALKKAEEIAANEGVSLAGNTVKLGHYTKLAVDDMIGAAKRAGDDNMARALNSAKGALLQEIETAAPAYAQGRQAFQAASQPINRMAVGREFEKSLQPALGEIGGAPRLTPQKFAQALREGDQTAARATEFGGATLENTLTPQDITTLRQVAEQLGRQAKVADSGRAAGSNTVQNLVSENALRNIIGGLKGGATANGEQSAITKLIGRTLIQPLANKSGATDEVINLVAMAAKDRRFYNALIKRAQKGDMSLNALRAIENARAPQIALSAAQADRTR